MSAIVFAQTRNLRDADRFFRNNRLDRAVASIKLAMAEPANQTIAEAWFNQGKIFTAVATSTNPEHRSLEENALELALHSFEKAFELDQTGRFQILGSMDVRRLIGVAYDLGATLYSEQRFAEAAEVFRKCVRGSTLIDEIDTSALFNVALCFDAAQNKEMAKRYYHKVVALEADQPAAYTGLAIIYMQENDTANAVKFADLAAELFPENYNASINAASIHLMLQNSERAEKILSRMSEEYADNPIVFFALGVAYDQIKMPAEAERAYLRAIELHPEYFDAIFNLGAFYVTQGVELKTEADALPWTENRRFDELIEQSTGMFQKAVPMLEKALEMRPNEIPVMATLRDIYVHLRMMDKAMSMSAEIERIEGR
jgi:tetratricopeptide (TPR) repeat protein